MTKKVTILTLTRIFLLTHGHQTLLREITTPMLKEFISSCLNLVGLKGSSQKIRNPDLTSPLLKVVLQALIRLIPNHPATFRPFLGQLKSFLAPLLAPTPSNVFVDGVYDVKVSCPSEQVTALAQRLYALLPSCAAKTVSDEWSKAIDLMIQHTHKTIDHLFRAVVEDGVSSSYRRRITKTTISYEAVVGDEVEDDLDLPQWSGTYAGAERLIGLLQLLQAYIVAPSAGSLRLPLGILLAMLRRILSVFAPSTRSNMDHIEQSTWKPEVSRNEREELWLNLPAIHATAVDTLSVIIARVGPTSMSFMPASIDLLSWTFEREAEQTNIRLATYRAVRQLIQLYGPSMSKDLVKPLSPILRRCCEDIMPVSLQRPDQHKDDGNAGMYGNYKSNSQVNGDAFKQVSDSQSTPIVPYSPAQNTAKALVLATLSTVSPENLSHSIRHRIDQVAILLQDEDLMSVSTLNPLINKGSKEENYSILPFLVRAHPASAKAEAIFKPRGPIISRPRTSNIDGSMEGDYESSQDGLLYVQNQEVSKFPSQTSENSLEGSTSMPQQTNTDLRGTLLPISSAAQAIYPSTPDVKSNEVPDLGSLHSPKRSREADEQMPFTSLTWLSRDEPVAKRPRTVESQDVELTPEGSLQVTEFQSHALDYKMSETGKALESMGIEEGGSKVLDENHGDDDESEDGSEIPEIVLHSDMEEDEEEEEDGNDATDDE